MKATLWLLVICTLIASTYTNAAETSILPGGGNCLSVINPNLSTQNRDNRPEPEIVEIELAPSFLYNGDQLSATVTINLDNVEITGLQTQNLRFRLYRYENLSDLYYDSGTIDSGLDTGIWSYTFTSPALYVSFGGQHNTTLYLLIEESRHWAVPDWNMLSNHVVCFRDTTPPDPYNGTYFDEYAEAAFMRAITYLQLEEEMAILQNSVGDDLFPWGNAFQFVLEVLRGIQDVSDICSIIGTDNIPQISASIMNDLTFDQSPFNYNFASIQNSLDLYWTSVWLEGLKYALFTGDDTFSDFRNSDVFTGNGGQGLAGLLFDEEQEWLYLATDPTPNLTTMLEILNDEISLLNASSVERSNLELLRWTDCAPGLFPTGDDDADWQAKELLRHLLSAPPGYANDFAIRAAQTLWVSHVEDIIELIDNPTEASLDYSIMCEWVTPPDCGNTGPPETSFVVGSECWSYSEISNTDLGGICEQYWIHNSQVIYHTSWEIPESWSNVCFWWVRYPDLIGEWQVEIHYDGVYIGSGPTFSVIEPNDPPQISLTSPNNNYCDESFTITWSDSDSDDNAIIYLFYDANSSDFDGVCINPTDPIYEDDPNEYIWDTSLKADGTYWLYALITDGEDQVQNYGPGYLTIDHNTSAISNLAISVDGNNVILYWGAIEEADGYKIYRFEAPYTHTRETVWTSLNPFFILDCDFQSIPLSFYKVTSVRHPTSIDMILTPAGTFLMGCDDGAPSEQPVHQVALTHDFFLSINEVTNEQYRYALQWAYSQGLVTATSNTVRAHGVELLDLDDIECEITFTGGIFGLRESPSNFAQSAYPAGYDPSNHPIQEVSWYGAACYCDWLSLMSGLDPYYEGNWDQTEPHNPYLAHGCRLPTEAEWEYAGQYNDGRTYPWGEATPDCEYANFGNIEFCVVWTTEPGSCLAGDSQLGLHDMAGNVWEWLGDFYGHDYYEYSPGTDPLGPTSGTNRMLRGGAWSNGGASALRCASRYGIGSDPSTTSYGVGFRICRTVNP